MARAAYSVTLRTAYGGDQSGRFAFVSGGSTPQPSTAAVEAAVAVLEADGASPTQAHVTSLRGVWNTLVASLTTYGGADAILDVNLATLTTQTAVRSVCRELERLVGGSGMPS